MSWEGLDQLRQERLVDRREVLLSLLPTNQDSGVGEDLEVVRDGGLRNVEELGALPARQLPGGCDFLNHPEAGWIGQSSERAHHLAVVHSGQRNLQYPGVDHARRSLGRVAF